MESRLPFKIKLCDRLLHNRFAQVLTLVLLWLTFFSLSLTGGLHSALVRFSLG